MVDQPLDPVIQANLLPDEQVLWTGGFDTSYTRNQNFRNGVISNALFILLVATFGYFLSRGNSQAFNMLDFVTTTLIVASIPLTLFAGITAIRLRRRAAQPPPTAQPISQYVLTHRRALLHDFTVRATWAVFLSDVQIQLRGQNERYGEVNFYPTPISEKPNKVFTFSHLADAADVYHRIIEAQKSYTSEANGEDGQIPPAVQASLRPDEQVLWRGSPDIAYRQQYDERQEVRNAVIAVLGFVSVVYLILLFMSGGKFNFSEYLQAIFVISACPLSAVALVVLVRVIRQRRSNARQVIEPIPYFYVLTNLRAFVYVFEHRITISILLQDTQIQLKTLAKGYGHMAFFPRVEVIDPKVKLTHVVTVFSFADIPNAAEVYRLILAAQTQIKSS